MVLDGNGNSNIFWVYADYGNESRKPNRGKMHRLYNSYLLETGASLTEYKYENF